MTVVEFFQRLRRRLRQMTCDHAFSASRRPGMESCVRCGLRRKVGGG